MLGAQGHGGVQAGEVGGALVDGDEDQDAAEVAGVVEVDGEVLAGGDGPGAVVAVEVDPRRAVQVAEGVAERLDDALGAVGQLEEGAEVEVERGPRGGVAGEPAAWRGRGLPVEVDVEGAGGGALLGEGDGGGRLGEGDGGGAGGGRGGQRCGQGPI
ncbi:hypothetical protein GCM10010295_24090 [Streptomyces intermedius]